MMEQYDAIVIGSGQAGGPISRAMVSAGWKTALIEARHVGGTCINTGCTPTKSMIASADVASLAREAATYGVQSGHVSVDLSKVRQRKNDIVMSFRGSQRQGIQKAGVDLIDGAASFTGPKTIQVKLNEGGVRTLTAKTIIIDTGGRPRMPNIEGMDQVQALDSTSIMELDAVPDHLLILGGGYVAVEFGQMFCRFGSQVTIIEMAERLMAREDPDVTSAMQQILQEDGIQLLLGSSAQKVTRDGGKIRLTVKTPDGLKTLEGSHLLAAVGRVPNTDGLNLPAAGVATTPQGFIQVNERLETNQPGVYAVGDVNGGPAFTHISYDDYRILKTNLLDHGKATTNGRILPYVVFTDPQLGRVGLSEQEARKQNRKIRVARLPMTSVARAIETSNTRGFMKAVVDADTGQILGAMVLGMEGGEIMSMIEIAMLGKMPYTVLKDAIFAHPTLAESLNNLFAALAD